jgi:hypothetical protein
MAAGQVGVSLMQGSVILTATRELGLAIQVCVCIIFLTPGAVRL